MTSARILVVDDEPQIQRALRAGLSAQGYTVTLAGLGEQALDQVALSTPDLIVLDLSLPDISGMEVCRTLREWTSVPILILSAREQERDKVEALDLGADDYLTKPFGMGELLARVRAGLRRQRSERLPAAAVLEFGDIRVDTARHSVVCRGEEVHVTPREYDLLYYLAVNADRVVTYRQILSHIWGPEDADETQYLRVHMGHLRQKLETDPARPQWLLTEPGVGYRFRSQS